MRAAGETPLPAATLLDSAESFSIPSRDPGRNIPCRMLRPQNGQPVKGVFMHIHGGGWVLQDETTQDPVLQYLADATNVLCISIGYRLAPESPFPAGPDDCYDSAAWLVNNAEKHLEAPLSFIGGESAGAHLAMLTTLHLLKHPDNKYNEFKFLGLLLHFGCYDLTLTPQALNFKKRHPLILELDIIREFLKAFAPGKSMDELKHPSISPLYADLTNLTLPAALFTCGTEDSLLDDTVFMSTKWMACGGEVVVKILPGAPHAYIGFPRDQLEGAREGMAVTVEFVRSKLRQ
jgi:acetyl esterase/lipase